MDYNYNANTDENYNTNTNNIATKCSWEATVMIENNYKTQDIWQLKYQFFFIFQNSE